MARLEVTGKRVNLFGGIRVVDSIENQQPVVVFRSHSRTTGAPPACDSPQPIREPGDVMVEFAPGDGSDHQNVMTENVVKVPDLDGQRGLTRSPEPV
jgi:hypothetical protein